MGTPKKTFFILCAYYLFFEGTLFLALWVMDQRGLLAPSISRSELSPNQRAVLSRLLEGKESFLTWDSKLGWVTRKEGKSKNGKDRINLQGLRADRLYSKKKPMDKIRIASYGDSFTYGAFIDVEGTWQEQLMHYDPRFQVLNFGVPGYSLDQAYLRFLKEKHNFDIDFVFIGYMSENINRLVNRFRPFYEPNTELVFSKPRFEIKAGSLEMLPSPLQTHSDYERFSQNPAPLLSSLLNQDYWGQLRPHKTYFSWLPSVRLIQHLRYTLERKYGAERLFQKGKPYLTNSEGFRVLQALMVEFSRSVHELGQKPVVILYPHPDDLRSAWKGEPITYQPLLEFLKRQKICFIDGMKAFQRWANPKSELFTKGHYTAEAYQIFLGEIHAWLTSSNPDNC